MRLRKNIRFLTRMRDARLKRLAALGPFLTGSLVTIARTCGNKRCKCAMGQKHRSYYLTYKRKGHTQTLYVPVDLVEEVKRWVQEYKRIKTLTQEVSSLQRKIIRRHVTERRVRQRIQASSKTSS